MSVKLAVEKDRNLTEDVFWDYYYKIGTGDDELADLVHFVFKSSNLSIVYVTAKNESNEALELIEILLNGGADVLLRKVVTEELDIIKITNPIAITSTSIVSLNQAHSSQPLYTVFLSLSYQTWLVIIVNIVILAITTTALDAKNYQNRNMGLMCLENLWKNFRNLLIQGRSEFHRSKMANVLFLVMILEFVILSAFYNGNFQAGYAIPTIEPINKFEDLLRKNVEILISTTSPSYFPFTKLCQEEPFETLRHRLREVDFEDFEKMSDNGTMIRNIEEKNTVVIDSISNLKDYVFASSKRPQNLRLADTSYFPSSLVLPLNKNISNDIVEILNFRINLFVETNQRAPYQRLLHLKIGLDKSEQSNFVDPLKLIDLMPIFVLHLVGNLVASICLSFERQNYYRKTNVKEF